MNQEKIGEFIAKRRKEKELTQQDLAERLGVSDRTIGNWENGRNMPDLSLLKPLCNELDINVNELLSGEKIKNEEYKNKSEENIINTINYGNKKINQKNNYIGIIFIIFGLFISISAMTIFPSESSWGGFYSVIGAIISLIGFYKFTKKLKYLPRILVNFAYFIIYISILLFIDYISVISMNQAPRFRSLVSTQPNVIIYETPFYNVYRINYDKPNEYYIVDTKKEYDYNTVPNVPFNRTKSGIDNIIKYKNKYIGDNSKTGNLISNLPLSEYGYTFEIDSNNLGLTINYHITDWYINDSYYLEESLIYNTVSIFALIDNVNSINYNFSGNEYIVTRKTVEENYPNYNLITDLSNKNNFNIYLENKINDIEFINNIFNKLFN